MKKIIKILSVVICLMLVMVVIGGCSLNQKSEGTLEKVKTKDNNVIDDTVNDDISQTPEIIDIKDLKVGSSFEEFTVKQISLEVNDDGSVADFALSLEGEFTSEGTLSYSDFMGGIVFSMDTCQFSTKILLSDTLGTINPFNWMIGFRNQDELISQLGEVTYNKLLNDPEYKIDLVLRVKDYGFFCIIPGEADGSLELIEIKEIVEVNNTATKPASSDDTLIESNGVNYYKFKSNETVSFDIDEDGTDELIKYTVGQDGLEFWQAKLSVDGYQDVEIDGGSFQPDYFIIIKFSDKYENKMNLIGIIDYGPSSDYLTNLYSIVDPTGRGKSLVSVGSVTAEIVTPDKYNENDMNDFNYLAVLLENEGIEAPVRLSCMSQTWFGRSLYTYYTTYVSLIDNTKKYNVDYITKNDLTTAKDIKLYEIKDVNTNSITIKAGEKVHLTATDNSEWVEMYSDDGGKGWFSLKDFTFESFEGYTMFD
jgi:hypothetical protein